MTWTVIFFLSAFWLLLQFASLVFSGSYIGTGELAIINPLVVFRAPEQLSLFGSAIATIEYYTKAIPAMLMWDYPWLDGTYAIIKWLFFYPLSAGIVFGTVFKLFFQRNI